MSSVSFQTPLTPEEKRIYGEQFRKLDEEELGIVTGEALKPLFAGSGLSGQKLSQVWALVDVNNNGFLNLEEYSAALRVIGHLQQYPSLPVTGDLYAHPPAKLAVLNGAQVGAQPLSPESSSSIPVLAPQDVSKYCQLFDRAANGAASLPGDKAKDILLKARLPTQTLGEVWGLCDRNTSGSLDKTEFVMAMHLIQLCMSNNPSVNPMPAALPSALWNSIGASVAATAAPLSANSTGISSLGRRSTITRLSSGVFNSASTDWLLTTEKKQQFDAIFDSLDKSNKGSLGSQALVPFFLSSRLNQDTLASIWDLADIHNNAEFTKVEFAIAMFLIQKKNAGVELPDVIPDQLLHSPALGLYQQQPQSTQQLPQQISQQIPQQQPHVAIPSRNTKPSFQEVAPPQVAQASNNGSLNDLMALNSSFASPPPQPPIRQNSGYFGREASSTGGSAVHSTKNIQGGWNSNVIREDDEDILHSQNIQQQQTPQQQTPQQQTPQQQIPQQIPQQQIPQQQIPQQRIPQQQIPQQQIPQQQIPQQQYQQGNQVESNQFNSAPQPVSKSAPPVVPPAVTPRASSSKLPKVPDFSSFALPGAVAGAAGAVMAGAAAATGHRNNDLYADAEASSQLSSATTEMANLSNQVNSLSKQASLTNERKARAEQELKRVNDMKATIEGKLTTLRSTHEQNVKQTEQMEVDLAAINRENENLNQQLAVTEGNYHAAESKLKELSDELQQAQEKNTQLKEQISSLNSMTAALQSQLTEKQQHVKQERSLVDVNSKQLEVNQITVANFQTEIQGLGDKLAIYLTKRKELDDYQKTVEDQHAQLQSKYQELESGNADLKAREQELAERNKQVEEQENLYEQHVERLQKMFDDLSKRKESLDKAEEDLEKQHVDYANKVHVLSERQMKLAMGELPSDTENIVSRSMGLTKHDEDVSKYVEDSVANSKLGNPANEGEERPESEVFDKDVPTTGSQTEADDESETRAPATNLGRNETLADRFEGDLNEYGIPRTQSLTSSVANNPPQSVMDDTDLLQKLDETGGVKTEDKDLTMAASHIPGHWEETTSSTAGTTKPQNVTESPSDPVNQTAIKEDGNRHISEQVPPKSIGKAAELPPIENLKLKEDSSPSSSDDEFEDTREDVNFNLTRNVDKPPTVIEEQAPDNKLTSKAATSIVAPSVTATSAPALPVRDEFDDAFAGLEQAADEETQPVGDDQQINESMEEFEKIEHKDLDEELQQNAFTGTLTTEAAIPVKDLNVASDNTSNDEWDEIFAGFGNAKAPGASENVPEVVQQQQPIPTRPNGGYLNPPVNRKLATTPRSLAVEELSGMGFTEQEATSALEKCNWDLEAATNFLLDNA